MKSMDIDRRSVLRHGMSAVTAAGFLPALAGLFGDAAIAQDAGPATPAAGEPAAPKPIDLVALVRNRAKALANEAFAAPQLDVPAPFDGLTEAQYRDIKFRNEQTLWRDQSLSFEIQGLPRGWIYETPVELWLLQDGKLLQLEASQRLFALEGDLATAPAAAPYAFSGFKLRGAVHQAGRIDDSIVFQGASYFRAVARNQVFGTFARALSINTARAEGEEFPIFRGFWIERPASGATRIRVHALLDSPSLTAGFTFDIEPGETTVMDVSAEVFPRRRIEHIGIAPLTSMFYHGPGSIKAISDVRPRVHNTDGLAIINGRNERIWRPVCNHRMLQVSAFVDENPVGFGLAQRPRQPSDYEDLDKAFERRPTVWVQPKAQWGKGSVELVEIPTTDEIHDNIVAYWRPASPMKPGEGVSFDYRLSFSHDIPPAWASTRVAATRVGAKPGTSSAVFAVDFVGTDVTNSGELPVAELSSSAGTLSPSSVRALPGGSGIRVMFTLDPGDTELIELRLVLSRASAPISETWLYRWTKP